MTKTKKWRIALIALMAAFAAVLFAAFGTQMRASGAEGGVLDGNTAEYTFTNDETHPWSYNRATNTWESAIQTKGNTSTTLTITASSEGEIAFDYRVSSEADGDKLTVKHGDITIVNGEDGEHADFTNKIISDVKSGDTITFTYAKDPRVDSYDDRAYIKGLRLPGFPDVSVTVTAGENGTLSYQDQTKQSTFTQDVHFGDTFEVEAVADENANFAYWEDEDHKIVSYNAKFDYFHCKNGNYTAVFMKNGEIKIGFSQIDGKNTWKQSADGDYYEADMEVIQSGQTGSLTYDFAGEGYYCFDYRESVDGSEFIYVYLDGVQVFSDYGYNINYTTVEKLPWTHKIYALPDEGFHRLEFVYADAGGVASPNSGHLDVVHVKDVKTPIPEDELNAVEYELQFNADLGDVYIIVADKSPDLEDFLQRGQQLVSGQQQAIPVGLTVFFGVFPNKEYQSSIDPKQNTGTEFVGTYLKDGTELSRYGLGLSADYAFYMKTEFTQEGITAGGSKSTDRYLEFRMQERAIAPETVAVNYRVGGDSHERENIENGKTYTAPYGTDNQFTVAISDYKGVEETLKVTANGSPVQMDVVADYFGFTLNNLTVDTTISIQVEYGDCYASEPFLIHINMTLDGELQDNLKPLGNVKIENDPDKPWVFSSTYSGDGMIAYIAGISGYGKGKGNSSLKFTVTGNGNLTFDFYLAGSDSYCLAGYNFNEPLGDADYGTKFKDGKGKVIAAGQCAWGNVYKESKIIDAGIVTSLSGTLGSGWFHAEIPVSTQTVGKDVSEDTEVIVYVAYGIVYDSSGYKDDVMAIRNIMYLQGKSTVNFKVVDDSSEQADDNGTIEAKIAGRVVTSGESTDMGDKLVLTAKPAMEKSFYAWRDVATGQVISYEKSITLTVAGDINVEAIMAPESTYAARIGETFYPTLDAAFAAAKSGDDKTVIIVDDITVTTATTVAKEITLVIPFNGDGEYYAEGNSKNATKRVSWGTQDLETKYLFRKVTFKNALNVLGKLYVGGVLHFPDQSAQAHTSGAYSQLVLSGESTTLTVGDGGYLDVCGRVTGEGQIVVKSGGKIIQPFLILDFAGGTNTSGLYGQDQTPFNRYSVINVQCDKGLKIEYKGELWGHASLYALGGVNALDAPIISYSDGTELEPRGFITLTEGGSVTAIYHDDAGKKIPDAQNNNNTQDIGYTELIFESTTDDGGALANSLTMTYSIVTISTANVVGFSIPYNYQIVLKSGKYSMEGNFKLMPGASLTVEEGATLTVKSGKNLLVYDGLVQSKMSGKSYPSAQALTDAGYSTNGNLIVNGTLVLEAGKEKYPTTFLGVVQTKQAGARIEVGKYVTLSGKIVDGGQTDYDCNLAEYDSSARVWAKTEETPGFYPLEAGKNYVSNYEEGDTFRLPAVTVTYESGDWGSAQSMEGRENCKDAVPSDGNCDYCNEPYKAGNTHIVEEKKHHLHESSSTFTTADTMPVDNLTGSWKEDHKDHVYDWSAPEDGDTSFGGQMSKTVDRQCTALGCTDRESKTILQSVGSFAAETYRKTAYTVEELFNKLYGEGTYASLGMSFEVTSAVPTLADAGDYTISLTISSDKGYFATEGGGTFETTVSFTFKIEPKALEVSIRDQQGPAYTGKEPNPAQDAYDADDLIEGDTLGITIKKAAGANAGDYDLTAELREGTQFSNKNYAVTFKYTDEAEAHSVYTIGKAKLTITADDMQSPKGEDLLTGDQLTYKVTGYVNDEDAQAAGLDAQFIELTTNADKDAVRNNYVITVTYTGGELTNYTVETVNGRYSVIEPLFNGLSFEDVTAEYDGAAHSLALAGTESIAQYDPHIVYDEEGKMTRTDVGSDTVTVTITVELDGITYTWEQSATVEITPCEITVNLLAQTKPYDGATAQANGAQGTGWQFAEGFAEKFAQTKAEVSVLDIALAVTQASKNAGSYAIHATAAEGGNFSVTFTNNDSELYTITPLAVEIKVTDITSTYGDDIAALKTQYRANWQKTSGAVLAGENLLIELDFSAVADRAAANAAGYVITGTAPASGDNINYTIHITDGLWKVNKKAITITVSPVNVIYSGTEPAAPEDWALKEGSALAYDESKTVLGVTLVKEEGFNAGSYDITASYNEEGNYLVTFEGEQDAYVIAPLDVSSTADFFIMADGISSVGHTLEVRFKGDPIPIEGSVSVMAGEDFIPLAFTIDPDTITGLGEMEVTLTINGGQNYMGSMLFTVLVTNADGYTSHLIQTLEQLHELADGLTEEALTADHYGTLKEVNALLASLSDAEKASAAAELAPFMRLVAAWNEAADTADLVETAHAVADSVAGGVLGAAAAVSALAAVAYVLGKGGLL